MFRHMKLIDTQWNLLLYGCRRKIEQEFQVAALKLGAFAKTWEG